MAKDEKPKKSRKLFDKIKDSGKDFVDGVKEEIQTAQVTTKEKTREYTTKKREEIRTTVERRAADTSTAEDVYFSTWAWFWAMIFSAFVCLVIFMVGITNPRFFLVGVLALIALPFIVIWCLIHMVPTIKIFGFTIFDRHRLSLRRQLSLGKEIARLFSREFLQESPIIAFFIFAFFVIFLFSLLFAFLPT
jgi:cation transport ATPase